jgi:hypothetical protein
LVIKEEILFEYKFSNSSESLGENLLAVVKVSRAVAQQIEPGRDSVCPDAGSIVEK